MLQEHLNSLKAALGEVLEGYTQAHLATKPKELKFTLEDESGVVVATGTVVITVDSVLGKKEDN